MEWNVEWNVEWNMEWNVEWNMEYLNASRVMQLHELRPHSPTATGQKESIYNSLQDCIWLQILVNYVFYGLKLTSL